MTTEQRTDLVNVTIDGKAASVPKGTLIIHAAEQVGVEIPVFCYEKRLGPVGACRMCLVEVEKMRGLQPACAIPVAEGMVVKTTTPLVEKQQKGMLEFLLINHPLDCPICDKGGECPLQNQTFKYGPGMSRFTEEKRHYPKPIPIGPHILLDRERCILCQLCVRFDGIVAEGNQLIMINRGDRTEISTHQNEPYDNVFSGNTIELCPVGALTSREYRFKARPWDLQHTPSTCPSCSVGCNITIDARRGQVLRITSRENGDVDDGWLCDHGRFGTLGWDRIGRVEHPMIKRDGRLVATTWETVLAEVVRGLTAARAGASTHAPIGGLAGATMSNEDLYMFGKLFRAYLGSNNLDTFSGSYAPTSRLGGAGIADIEKADVVLVLGADPIAHQPVIDLRFKKAYRLHKTKILIAHAGKTGLDALATARTIVPPGGMRDVVTQLTQARLAGDPEGRGVVQPMRKAPTDLIGADLEAARPADGGDLVATLGAILAAAKNPLIVYDESILHEDGGLLGDLHELARACGEADGAPRLLALCKDSNSRGVAEMGADPRYLPGGADVTDEDARGRLSDEWGMGLLASGSGMRVGEMLRAAASSKLQALYLMGCDPLEQADDREVAEQALSNVPFLVVQTATVTRSMGLADVVLPSLGFGEKNGTITNTEGRVQGLGRATRGPEDAHDDWEILAEVMRQLGGGQRYLSAGEVASEITALTGLPGWQSMGRLPEASYTRPPRQLVVNR